MGIFGMIRAATGHTGQTTAARATATAASSAQSTKKTHEAPDPKTPRPQHSPKNQAFVRKYGFGDASNKEVSHYRHLVSGMKAGLRHLVRSEKRMDLSGRIDEFVQKAGSNPKLRHNLETFCRLAASGQIKSTAQLLRTMDMLERHPGMPLKTHAQQKAFGKVIQSKAFLSGKLSPEAAAAVTQVAAKTRASTRAVDAMATYLSQTEKAHKGVRFADAILAKMHVDRKKDEALLRTHLEAIAKSKHPEETAKKLAATMAKLPQQRLNGIKKLALQKYADVLRKAGVHEGLAKTLNESIYTLGGPRSPGARALLTSLARASGHSDAWAAEILKKMDAATGGFDPRQFHAATNTPMAAMKPFTPQKTRGVLDKLSNAVSIAGEVSSTSGTIAEALEFGTAATVGSVGAFVCSVAGGVMSLMQIGRAWLDFHKNDKVRSEATAYWAAIDYFNDTGDNFKSLSEARRDGSVRHRKRHCMSDDGHAVFDTTFEQTYEALARMPSAQRRAFVSGLVAIREDYARVDPDNPHEHV